MHDLKEFLMRKVLPRPDDAAADALASCAKIAYLAPGERLKKPGVYVVYKGLVEAGGEELEEGDYAEASEVRGVKESIVLRIEPECWSRYFESPITAEAAEECIIGNIVSGDPLSMPSSARVIDAVREMASRGVSSVIVVSSDGRPIGIFTDTDLRRMVAESRSLDTPLSLAATPSPVSITPEATCLEAVYRMMERGVKHLVVVDPEGRLKGVVTARDIAYRYGSYYLYYLRRVERARSPGELRLVLDEFKRRIGEEASKFLDPALVPRPLESVRLASLVYRAAVARAVTLATRGLGEPPGRYAYMLLGSGGRMEQFLVTDRDTMLVYGSGDPGYYRELASRIEGILDEAGFPGCRHGYTSRNLLYSVEELSERIRAMARDVAGNIVELSLIFDAQAVKGYEALALQARRMIHEAASANQGPLLEAMMAFKPALGALGRLPRNIDLKTRGIAPIVLPVKALSMIHGIVRPTNTVERIDALEEAGIIPRDLARGVRWAYLIILRRLIWVQATTGRTIIDTSRLPGSERSVLKAAFREVRRLHGYVERNYGA